MLTLVPDLDCILIFSWDLNFAGSKIRFFRFERELMLGRIRSTANQRMERSGVNAGALIREFLTVCLSVTFGIKR